MRARTTRWLSAGVVSGGIAAALIAGAGTAIAVPDTGTTGTAAASGTESAGPESAARTSEATSTKSTDATAKPEGNVDPPEDGPGAPAADGLGAPAGDEPGAPAGDELSTADEQTAEDSETVSETLEPADPADTTNATDPQDSRNATGAVDVEDTVDPQSSVSEFGETDTAAPVGMSNNARSVTADIAVSAALAAPDADADPAPDANAGPDAAPDANPPNADAAPDANPPDANADTDTTQQARDAAPAVATLAMTAAAEDTAVARKPTPLLLNLIGTVFFGLYSMMVRIFEGPPMLPRGSTVTVETSTLTIDCGNGLEVPANWYFPDSPAPDRLIYLQHGFMASAPLYSHTAAYLAEKTNSVVVALSLTSNFFACDSCWLGGDAMHRAIAKVFSGDREALTDSASRALGHEVTLPRRFVIAGHSAGGGLALGVANYLDDDTMADLAGLMLLDGVALGDIKPSVIEDLPDDLPILQISSPPYMWNMFGYTSEALAKARPGRFNGAELVGGGHIDLMQGGNAVIQFGAYLVARFSAAKNVEAARMLAADWINEMFAGGDDFDIAGQTVAPGATAPIVTDRGTASAIALPASESNLSPTQRLIKSIMVGLTHLIFGLLSPTVPSSVGLAREQEISTPNAA